MAIFRISVLLVFLILFSSSCATYYQKNIQFQEEFVSGNFTKANGILDKDSKAAEEKNRLLFFLQKGVVLQSLGLYEESNIYLERAYTFIEDYKRGIGNELGSLLTNPTIKPYVGEDHENVLIHYYKVLNFLLMKDTESALVECRRLNNKINTLNDRYEKRKNRYKVDAFAQNIMGLCYEAEGEINDAFIAYKNAVNAYENSYAKDFDTPIPLQLKKDVIRLAHLNGFDSEKAQFEKKFGIDYQSSESPQAELVLFVHNGLGPIKDEWSLNFFIVRGKGGAMTFVNEELGLSFPFVLENNEQSTNLGDLKFVRVAFPKYLTRKPYYRSFKAVLNGKSFNLESAENINAIAISTLQDRMNRELGRSLLRLAAKQAAEALVKSKNANLGALLSVFDAVSEKADTRNWQTLPYEISYARIPLEIGDNLIDLEMQSPMKSIKKNEKLHFEGIQRKMVFGYYNNLESLPLGDY